jgi:hypothetical protein
MSPQLDQKQLSNSHSPTVILANCLPGVAALIIYPLQISYKVPRAISYSIWPLLFVGVVIGIRCLLKYRKQYPKESGP